MVGKVPNCEECRPHLMPENIDAHNVYQQCRRQHIMGSRGPVDINIGTVMRVMELHDVEDKKRCLDLVHMVYNHFLIKAYEESQANER